MVIKMEERVERLVRQAVEELQAIREQVMERIRVDVNMVLSSMSCERTPGEEKMVQFLHDQVQRLKGEVLEISRLSAE